MNIKYPLLISLGLLLATSLFVVVSQPAAPATVYTDVTVMQAKAMIDSDPSLVILDVRNQSEYITGHIRNAKLIPLFQLNDSLNQLDPADHILVYCRAGYRSATASQILAADNFTHIYNMLGGITDWAREEYATYIQYPSIQEAMNNATEGGTLYVSQGQYLEHLSVNKPLVLIGEDKDTTIVDGTNNGTVFYVDTDNTLISNFRIQSSGCACAGYCGINIESNHKNINITDSNIISDGFGIQMDRAQSVSITYNNITGCNDFCMVLHDSTRVSILENNIQDNIFGINIVGSTQTVVFNNNITRSHDGISLTKSDNNTITYNNITSNGMYGIYISQSNDNVFHHNSLMANSDQVSNHNSTNIWDDGSEGNYWSDYNGTGSTPYVIDAENQDNHPLLQNRGQEELMPTWLVPAVILVSVALGALIVFLVRIKKRRTDDPTQ